MPTTDAVHAVDAMRAAAVTARNDEILEVTMFIFELLAERAENALELAVDADDRDALNEVCVFAARADELMPWSLGGPNRVRSASRRIDRVKDQALAEIEESRSKARGPKPKSAPKPIILDVGSLDDEEIVAVFCEAVRQNDAYDMETFGRAPRGNARAAQVAQILAGGRLDDRAEWKKVRHSDVIRVGQRLGGLARSGRIEPANKPHEGKCYAPKGSDDA